MPPRIVRKRSITGRRTPDFNQGVAQTLTTAEEERTSPEIQQPSATDEIIPKSPKYLWGLANIGSEVLENNGAVARDHMANERTFLSWIRTSLGLTTVGVGITQLYKLVDENHSNDKTDEFLLKVGKPIGGTFISIAILCVILGTIRFFKVQEFLKDGKYPASRFSVSVLVLLVFSISAVTLASVIYSSRMR